MEHLKKTRRVNTNVPPELKRALTEYARKEGLTEGQAARRAFVEFLKTRS